MTLKRRLSTLLICAGLFAFSEGAFAQGEKYEIKIENTDAASALTALALQTKHPLLFDFSQVKFVNVNSLEGQYTLREALDLILKDTGLSGSLSSREVISIVAKQESIIPSKDKDMTFKGKNGLLTGASAAILSAMTASPALAQTPPPADTPIATERPNTVSMDGSDEIIVTGRKLDSLLGIEEKRNAKQIIDVLMADAANKLPDNNVAESLSRIPGVSLRRDNESGDGQFIFVRGLDAALLNIQFDGINVGTASTDTRTVALNGISANNVSQIRVSKSLQPSDESEGIGGSVNIISKTPLGIGEDIYTVDISGRYGEFSKKLGHDISASATKIFNDNVGIRISGQKTKRFIRNLRIETDSPILTGLPGLDDANGNFISASELLDRGFDDTDTDYDELPVGAVSPEFVTFESFTHDLQRQERDLYSLSGALDWQVAPHTLLTFGGRYSEETTDALDSQFTFDESDDDFILDTDGTLLAEFDGPDIELQTRIEDRDSSDVNIYLKGLTETNNWTINYTGAYTRSERDTPRIALDLRNFIDLELEDGSDLPFHPYGGSDNLQFPTINPSVANNASFRETFDSFNDNAYISRINASLASPDTNDRYLGKLDFKYDVDSSKFGGVLQNIAFGGKYEHSNRFSPIKSNRDSSVSFYNVDGTFAPDGEGNLDIFTVDADGEDVDAVLANSPGLFGGFDRRALALVNSPLLDVGVPGIPVLDEAAFRAFGDNVLNTYAGRENDVFSQFKEDNYAAYVQAEFDFGRLEFTAGLRYDLYEGDFAQSLRLTGEIEFEADDSRPIIDISNPDINDIQRNQTTNDDILPRINGNFEIRDDLQLRFGAGYSIARPSFRQLGRSASTTVVVEIDENFNPAPDARTASELLAAGGITPDIVDRMFINVTAGNPDLKNSKSRNLDLSLEYYPTQGTAFTVGAFHKRIKNFIFIGEERPDGGLNRQVVFDGLSEDGLALLDGLGGLDAIIDQTALVRDLGTEPAFINVVSPQNGGIATVKGLEFAVRHQFDYLPSFWSNFGFSGHLTLTDSEATALRSAEVRGTRTGEVAVELGLFEDGQVVTQQTSFRNIPNVAISGLLFYEDDKFDIALSGNYRSDAYLSDTVFGFNNVLVANYQLDFFAGYTLPENSIFSEAKIFVEIPDITDGGRKPTTPRRINGDGPYTDAGYNGREVRFGLRSKF